VDSLERAKNFIAKRERSADEDLQLQAICDKICRILNIVAMIFLKKGRLNREH
jgi:hypothetical protein